MTAARRLRTAAVVAITGGAVTSQPLAAAQDDPGAAGLGIVEITEWEVPWANTRPRDPFVDGQGRVWFVGQVGDYVAYLDSSTGEFTRFDLDPGTGPHNLIVDVDGIVWYAGNKAAHIGRLDPATGDIDEYPMPDPDARDPHTLVFDSNGDIWFTVQSGNFVGHLSTEDGTVKLVDVPTPAARPYGIRVDQNDWPWIAEFGSYKIATVDPATFELTEYELPRESARPRRLEVTSDGMVWYVDYAEGLLGRLDAETGEIQEWAVPGGARAGGYAMVVDDRDRIWFFESTIRPNRLVGFDTAAERFFSLTEVPSGGGTVRHAYYYAPAREIWFGTDTNYIGRARVP